MNSPSFHKDTPLIDHLFRHQSGKMVAVLVRIFGLSNLELIEDAVQDTFIKAMASWKMGIPEQPEAWLVKAAKNRAIDLLRSGKIRSDKISQFSQGAMITTLDDLFSTSEIEDSQLRMVFTACHPELNSKEQISFALKTISGFGDKEIAAALLTKIETVKKRLSRARKLIKTQGITFTIPTGTTLNKRLNIVHEVLYLIFNEGYHSSAKKTLVRKDLCAEAIRLCSLILKKAPLRTGEGYALFAIFCFHAARLDAKISDNNHLLDLKQQDRSNWNRESILLGNSALNQAMQYDSISQYHLEAAILGEHLNAPSFEQTNWDNILAYYQHIWTINPSDLTLLNLSLVLLQLNEIKKAQQTLQKIKVNQLEQRKYLYFGLQAELYAKEKNLAKAIDYLNQAIATVNNDFERQYLQEKKEQYKKIGNFS